MTVMRALVDIGFFLSIVGFIVYPFVSEELTRQGSNKTAEMRQGEATADEQAFLTDTRVDMPQASQASASFTQPSLTIDGVGRQIRVITLDGRVIRLEGLPAELRKLGLKRLRIRGAPDLANQAVLDVKRQCALGGVTSFEDTWFRRPAPRGSC